MRHVRQPQTPPSAEALATSRKIDAIESEISAEYVQQQGPSSSLSGAVAHAGMTDDSPATISQALDEAALLFANRQADAAKALLLRAIATCSVTELTPVSDRDQRHGQHSDYQQAWWMLFELALSENQPAFFDALAVDYAQTFETSPPQWKAPTCGDTSAGHALPVVNFRGKLCGSSAPALHQLQQLGSRYQRFCMAVGAITDIDLDGCDAMLKVIAHWQSQACSFRISGGEVLTTALRTLIQPGRRDSNDAGWRLAIEWMRLMNCSQAYEELCVDYSMTYEISPPVPLQQHLPAQQASAFIMPECIAQPVDSLLAQMERHAGEAANQAREASVLVLDCRHLLRVEFSAAVPWLNGLHRVAGGKTVECRHTSFLVSRLLQLVGGKRQLNLINRKP